MNVSLISDEISGDVETAFELGVEWGVRDFELRGLGAQRVPMITDFDKQRLRELIEAYGVRIVAISPGLFKCPYPAGQRNRFPLQAIDAQLYRSWRDARAALAYHCEELLPASLEFARELGAPRVICFSFARGPAPHSPAPDDVLATLRSAAGQAANAGLELAIEVEAGFWADTGQHSADLVREVGHPALGINWDPANAFETEEAPYPGGYQAARPYVRHVHFKDARRSPQGAIEYVVEGQVDWEGQIRALAADGYAGWISVEPHMIPKVASARALLGRVQNLVKAASRVAS